MKFINNVNETLRDDMAAEMQKGSKLSIAAAYFLSMLLRLCAKS